MDKFKINTQHLTENLIVWSAVIVAAPIYYGVFMLRVGGDPHSYLWLEQVEGISGVAMAIIEAFAIGFVMKRANLMPEGSRSRLELKAYAWAMALMIPIIGLPYLLTGQGGISVAQLFSTEMTETAIASVVPVEVNPIVFSGLGLLLQIAWNAVTLFVTPAIVLAVGAASVDKVAQAQEAARVKDGIKDAKGDAPKGRKLPGKPSPQGKFTEECPHCNRYFAKSGIKQHESNCKG